ncbi:MAG: accessory Sec system glycosyltransferase Asp1 [Streptococcaceae bacterium]|nr:accessory Sec system glycosyltransferase Asp1 [Streptococcaceae bacterium]
MNYFVNENIFTLNSGTEFSAVKRLKMFRQKGIPAKILTRNYNANLSGDLTRVGLMHEDVLNMYDYFQEVTDIPSEDLNVRYAEVIDKRMYHIEGVDANESLIKYHGDTVAKVNIAPATVGLLGSIEYYNNMNVIVVRDVWDRRGFKSSTQYFHQDGNLGPQIFFDRNGIPKIEVIHMNINGTLSPTMWKLLNYKGKTWRFNSEDELFAFFMTSIAQEGPSVFINDRPSLVPAVAAVQGAVAKWHYLHNVHGNNINQSGAPRQVAPYMQPLFTTFISQFNGVIVATEQQKKDIQQYFNFNNVLVLPDSFAEEVAAENLKFDLEARDKNKIVYLGRMAEDKSTLEIVDILSRVHRKLPNAKIEVYGYASPADYQKQIEDKAEKAGLKDSIIFKGYQSDEVLATALKEASLVLNTSPAEGYGMNLLHAMSFGVPVVAYRVKYGIEELVESGVDGELVQRGSAQLAADAVVNLLNDSVKWSAASRAAFDKAQSLNLDAAWSKWLEMSQTVENIFVQD